MLEFEMDDVSTNVLVDGESTITNVIAVMREPGLMRVHAAHSHDEDFVVPGSYWSTGWRPYRQDEGSA